MANENNNKEREKYSLNVTEFEPFNATKVVRVITTQNLAKLLNERIKPAFADYRGCFIEPLPNGQGLSVTLTFNQVQHEEGNAYAFESIESQRGQGDIASRAAHLYSEFSNGRKWKITQDGIDILEGLMATYDPKKINCDRVTSEAYEGNGFVHDGRNIVNGLDFNRCMELIFGSKNEDGSKIYYNPIIMQPVINTMAVRPNNWTIQLEMMTDSSVQDMCNEVGYVSLGQYNCVQA